MLVALLIAVTNIRLPGAKGNFSEPHVHVVAGNRKTNERFACAYIWAQPQRCIDILVLLITFAGLICASPRHLTSWLFFFANFSIESI
jgi:hypothetical protein